MPTSGQELGFERSHNGGWQDDEKLINPKARLLECEELGSYRLPRSVEPGIIKKKCKWSVHKCLWHCKATPGCFAFEFGTGSSGGDPSCRYYSSNSSSGDYNIGTRISDPSIIFESFIRCKKGANNRIVNEKAGHLTIDLLTSDTF